MLDAGAQGHPGGAGLEGVAHQVPHRLGEPVHVAEDVGDAGVVITLHLHRPAAFGLGQAKHAFEHHMDVEALVRA